MALSIATIKAALDSSAYVVDHAAHALNITPRGLRKRIAANPELKEYLDDHREHMVDLAESTLLTELKAGNLTAAIFIAKTLGRDRGYADRTELTGANGGPVQIAKGFIGVSPDDWDGDSGGAAGG